MNRKLARYRFTSTGFYLGDGENFEENFYSFLVLPPVPPQPQKPNGKL
jgi:hypothetical protein